MKRRVEPGCFRVRPLNDWRKSETKHPTCAAAPEPGRQAPLPDCATLHPGYSRGPAASLSDVVIGEVLFDVRLEGPGRGDVGVALSPLVLLQPGQPAPVERTDVLRIRPEHGIEIGDGLVHLPGFQVGEA